MPWVGRWNDQSGIEAWNPGTTRSLDDCGTRDAASLSTGVDGLRGADVFARPIFQSEGAPRKLDWNESGRGGQPARGPGLGCPATAPNPPWTRGFSQACVSQPLLKLTVQVLACGASLLGVREGSGDDRS